MPWCAPGADSVEWRHWDDESVLYDCRSGQTHLLTTLASAALQLLARRDLEVHELARQLAETWDLPDTEEFAAQIGTLLRQLDDLGLVEYNESTNR